MFHTGHNGVCVSNGSWAHARDCSSTLALVNSSLLCLNVPIPSADLTSPANAGPSSAHLIFLAGIPAGMRACRRLIRSET